MWSQDLYHEITISNANYSSHMTAELLRLGDILRGVTVIGNSWKWITWRTVRPYFAAETINTTVCLQGDFFFLKKTNKKHSLKLLETMLVETGVCSFWSAVFWGEFIMITKYWLAPFVWNGSLSGNATCGTKWMCAPLTEMKILIWGASSPKTMGYWEIMKSRLSAPALNASDYHERA